MIETWIHACATGDLAIGSAKVIKGKHLGRSYQVAVFRTKDEGYYATDNLCPHEGYPLVQGYVKDCVLTCAWHNFKFKLDDGECIKGDEAVTTHPVRVRGEAIEFCLSNAGRSIDVAKTFASLEEGLIDNQMARVARDVVRLLQADVPATTLLLTAARFDCERAEWGTNHGFPVAVDAMLYLDRYTGIDAALPIMQAMECAAEQNIRRPVRPLADLIVIDGDAATVGAEIRGLVESEDYPRAEGLLRGALEAGFGREDIEPWFLNMCSDHFLGFGHPLIYTVKAFDFLDTLGFEYAPHILPALLYRIANSTREDTLPPMAFLATRLDELSDQIAAWSANKGAGGETATLNSNRDQLVATILDGTKHEACAGIERALNKGLAPLQIVDALSLAAAGRLLRFDRAHDASDACQEGWLDITHGITYVHAIRKTLRRCQNQETIRLLFYAAHFILRTKPLDRKTEAVERILDAPPSVAGIRTAVLAGDAALAVAITREYLQGGNDLASLREACEDFAIGDHFTRPIVVAHAIKTCIAVFEEHAALEGDPTPILALMHFAASPVRERVIGRNVHEAKRFIAEGKPPRRLTL